MTRKRTVVLAFVFAAIGYFVVLPMSWTWLVPHATASVPQQWPYDKDMPISVTVSAWHSNFVVWEVRLYVDYYQTTAHGASGMFLPDYLYTSTGVTSWTRWKMNPLTWPRTRTLEVTLPLSELAQSGRVKPGIVVGKLDVEIKYPPRISRLGRYRSGPVVPENIRETIPVTIELQPH